MTAIDPAPDPALVHAWLAGRSLSRALPAPVADHGGWRVDTDGETERRRYVFAAAGPGLTDVLHTMSEPRVFVKLCADAATFRPLLSDGWTIVDENRMMVADDVPEACDPPPGYTLDVTTHRGVTHVTITAPDGEHAASGYAAEANGVFVYDRIVTTEAHRRRGLGRTLMSALGAARQDSASRPILTTTDMGAALYAALGWRTYCPYTTATRL